MIITEDGRFALTTEEMMKTKNLSFLVLNCGHYIFPMTKKERDLKYFAHVTCPGCGKETFTTSIDTNMDADVVLEKEKAPSYIVRVKSE
jgi:hypothetical protein